jgi:hypothetical protein
MTTARYDGALLAPAARLRAHGALRLALARPVSIRQASGFKADGNYRRAFDDAALATFPLSREEGELSAQACYPF